MWTQNKQYEISKKKASLVRGAFFLLYRNSCNEKLKLT